MAFGISNMVITGVGTVDTLTKPDYACSIRIAPRARDIKLRTAAAAVPYITVPAGQSFTISGQIGEALYIEGIGAADVLEVSYLTGISVP